MLPYVTLVTKLPNNNNKNLTKELIMKTRLLTLLILASPAFADNLQNDAVKAIPVPQEIVVASEEVISQRLADKVADEIDLADQKLQLKVEADLEKSAEIVLLSLYPIGG